MNEWYSACIYLIAAHSESADLYLGDMIIVFDTDYLSLRYPRAMIFW